MFPTVACLAIDKSTFINVGYHSIYPATLIVIVIVIPCENGCLQLSQSYFAV